MLKKTFRIVNKYGLHARPAAQFVRTTSKFKSQIYISKDGFTADGKSIMGLMTLAAEMGSEIEVSIEGADEEQAMEAIGQLIASKFNEE